MNLLDRASKIAEGFNSSIYQLSDDTYGQEVILKVMKEEFNYHPHSSQLYNEDKFLRNIETKGIRASLDLIEDQVAPILVLEYFDGKSLKQWRQSQHPSFLDCLKIAISITECLSEVHSSHKLIHRDISSHNILINHNNEIQLIDFGLAINVDIKLSVKGMSDQLLGTLPYISPEQTGRVNHAVDYRSDLYSLGVVFYELFTGELPFQSGDPLELIHAHLAMIPKKASEINSNIPPVFSDILAKLLEKNVENRYQSARGLLNDLQKCLEQLAMKVEIHRFDLAENDESGQFQLPSQIYGRADEIESLIKSIDQIGSNSKQITLVSGKSGTGKTSLIYEIYKPITQKKGYFIKGKHQQYQKDRPYQAITQALSGLVSLLLSENEERLSKWRDAIINALGEQGKLITDLIPNLELIIGKQEKLPILGINEAQNRFNYIFSQFVRALATKEHPIVMFIDDLQWTDNASLKLLKHLITEADLPYFYFIGAYRDNELYPSHPVNLVFKELPRQGITIQELHLNDLEFEHVLNMVQDTFKTSESKSRVLSNIIYGKTAGNPFFVSQFLKSIYESELVWFNAKTREWTWDAKGLESTNFTDNVVEFMIEKLRKMDQSVQTQLTYGACIGDRFDLQTLSYIQQEPTELLDDLWKAVVEQLLVVEESQGDVALMKNITKIDLQSTLVYRFAHDRIRQAAYELIPEEEKSKVHQQIGELLLNNIDLKEDPDRIFDVVDQLNLGVPSKDDGYNTKLAQLNLTAGKKAASATANDSALRYHTFAKKCLNESFWQSHHHLCFEIYLAAMESNYLLGDYEAMDALGNALLDHAQTKIEKLKTYNILVQSYIARGKHIELIDFGLSILKIAGIKLPSNPKDLDILKGLIKTKVKLRGKSMAYFKQLPEMEDESMSLAINMMTSISTASYHNFPKLFPLVIFKSMQLSLKHGNSMDSIPFYGAYGTILCGVLGQYDKGFEFGQLSLALLERSSKNTAVVPKTLVIYHTFINHWKEHLELSQKPTEEAYLVSLEIGDNQYAATSAFQKSYTSFLLGRRLPEVQIEMEGFIDKMQTLNQKGYFLYQQIVYQGISNLVSADNKQPWILKGNTFDESVYRNSNDELSDDGTAHFHIAYYKLYLNYLFGRYEDALAGADQCKNNLDVILSTAYIPVVYFYDSLTCIRLASVTKESRNRLIKRVRSNQKKMKKWANHAPMNFMHKYLAVEAELLGLTQPDKLDIKEKYDKALRLSDTNDYLNEQAMIYELAGRHFHKIQDEALQLYYLTKAIKAYRQWGALSKVNSLKQEFPFIQEERKRDIQTSFSEGSFSYGSMSGNNLLDLASVLKAASTISSEIQLTKAIPKLLDIVVENAGAQTGAFLLIEENKANLYAKSSAEGTQMTAPKLIDANDQLPLSVIQYVLRTKDTVILDEPVKDERFDKDDYLRNADVASLLCLPIIHQQELIGIIYLENRLTKGSFNTDRTDLLSLLSGQIAVTVHNAMLYDTLEQKVVERTREIEKQKAKLNRQNKQLADLNEEKDFLISVVSHDLRNPLHLIKGYTNLVLKESENEKFNEFLGHVVESSERMEKFITRILNVSAINSGNIELNLSLTNISTALQDEVNNFKTIANEKNITLTYCSKKQQLKTKIDTGYFNQIISNLVSNAIKYTQKGGQVEVSLCILESGDYFRIVVSDNGQGISIREQKLLFSRFQTLSPKPTDGEASTGIGLAIVKKYVEALNGSIWCESEYEKGSKFFVEFPIER